MTKPIENPYAAAYDKMFRKHNVTFRSILHGEIHFTFVCSCVNSATATLIASLLNDNRKEK